MNIREKQLEMLESAEHERRMAIIAQNGNSGLNYEQDMLSGFNKSAEQLEAIREEERRGVQDIDVVYEVIKPTDKAAERKATPVFSGVLKYFPNALKEVAKCSQAGNDQHHPDKPLHWDMSKSTDEYDALTRHLIDHTINPIDDDGVLHLAKVAWRALAGLERHLTNKL
jgi:hypothetical protein